MAAFARSEVRSPLAPDATVAASTRRNINQIGFWSAVLTAIFYIGWLLGLAVSFVLPSPWGFVAMATPSLFIPLAWVPLMLCIRASVSEERRIYGDISSAFAVMYGALLSMNYFIALTVTVPKQLAGANVGLLTTEPQSPFHAVEALGYSLMSLSALFAGVAFGGTGLRRWIRWLLIVTGVFAAVLPFQVFFSTWPSLPQILSTPREFTLTAAVILLAVFFRRMSREATGRTVVTRAQR